MELEGTKVAEVPILAHLSCTLPFIAQNWFYLSHRALGPKCTPWASTNVPDMGVQTRQNRHFTSPAHRFVVYCAKPVCSIPSCFEAKM